MQSNGSNNYTYVYLQSKYEIYLEQTITLYLSGPITPTCDTATLLNQMLVLLSLISFGNPIPKQRLPSWLLSLISISCSSIPASWSPQQHILAQLSMLFQILHNYYNV